LWRSISLLSNFCLILRDLFLIYFNFGIGNKTSTVHASGISRLTLTYKHYLFNGFLIRDLESTVDHAVKYCILGARYMRVLFQVVSFVCQSIGEVPLMPLPTRYRQ
jgi:hypothetical protein